MTRNSDVADKPRDAFVQMQWRGWSKTPPLHMCYHAQFCRSSLKTIVMIEENIRNWGALPPFGWGHGCSLNASPLPKCVTTSNLVVLR